MCLHSLKQYIYYYYYKIYTELVAELMLTLAHKTTHNKAKYHHLKQWGVF